MQIMDRQKENEEWLGYKLVAESLGPNSNLLGYIRAHCPRNFDYMMMRIGKIIARPKKREELLKIFEGIHGEDKKLMRLLTDTVAQLEKPLGYCRMI